MKQLFNPITATVWKGSHGASSSICPTKQAIHCVPIIPYRLQCILGVLISLIFLFTTTPLFAGNIRAPENVRIIKIVDNGDYGTSSTGNWQVSNIAGSYGDNSLYSRDGGAIYTFEAAIGGVHEVLLWWTEYNSRSTSVPVEIYDGNKLLKTIKVNQQANGGKWNDVGAYEFKSGTAKVTILAQNEYSTCADAVKFDPNPPPSPPPSTEFHPGFFVFQAGDITNTLDLIKNESGFIGIKKVYTWKNIETSEGVYDFSEIISDLAELQVEGKRLWIQLGYTLWGSSPGNPRIPEYMWYDSKYGGVYPHHGVYSRKGIPGASWTPIIWNSEVQARFEAVYTALGNRFNGEAYLEGITVAETSTGKPKLSGETEGFSVAAELAGFKVRALAVKSAFPNKSFLHMINYTIGWDREEFGAWCLSHGIGIGTPDFTIDRPDNSVYTIVYPMMKNSRNVVPGGPDVQWADYEKINLNTGKYYTAAELLDAIDLVDPWYFFWEKREPYFTSDVIPAVREFHKNGGNLGHN